MGVVIAAALSFAGIHLLISGTRVRDGLVARLGERAYRALFSILSAAALGALIWAYGRSSFPIPTEWPKWPALPLMFIALLLVVYGVTTPGPTIVGGEKLLDREARGMHRVTRHPMLWGFVIWAALHMMLNPQPASLWFFGSFLVTALAGTFSIDAKRARAFGEGWQRYVRQTSNVPFAAIVTGRNRLVPREFGWVRPLATLLVWGALVMFHGRLFGVPSL